MDDKRAKTQKAYWDKNRDVINAKRRKKYAESKEESRAKQARYCRDNRERVREVDKKSYNKRMKERGTVKVSCVIPLSTCVTIDKIKKAENTSRQALLFEAITEYFKEEA